MSNDALGHTDGTLPTIVMVHGAFADASDFNSVIEILQRAGHPVLAVANPLRGLESDADYLRSILGTLAGPIVLVGHSYGGAVITNGATGVANVKALVYFAAFVPDKGETIGQFADPTKYPGAELSPEALIVRPYPGGVEATIDPARFHDIFAADLPQSQTTIMAARQRPVSLSVFEDVSGEPAWRTIPSWYQVSSQDKAISPLAERYFAERIGAHTTEIDASHAGFAAHPETTARLIETAAADIR